MKDIVYDVYYYDWFMGSFKNKGDAVEFAEKGNATTIVKFDNHNFEPIGVVWEN